jgi:6,7-dimethyl-8-ribityllumazine synthase
VANESASGLQLLAVRHGLAIGNGVLTVENEDQAFVRARADGQDKGGGAARAALAMIALKRKFKTGRK